MSPKLLKQVDFCDEEAALPWTVLLLFSIGVRRLYRLIGGDCLFSKMVPSHKTGGTEVFSPMTKK